MHRRTNSPCCKLTFGMSLHLFAPHYFANKSHRNFLSFSKLTLLGLPPPQIWTALLGGSSINLRRYEYTWWYVSVTIQAFLFTYLSKKTSNIAYEKNPTAILLQAIKEMHVTSAIWWDFWRQPTKITPMGLNTVHHPPPDMVVECASITAVVCHSFPFKSDLLLSNLAKHQKKRLL